MCTAPSVNRVLLLSEKCLISLDLTGLQLITHVLELHLNMRWATFWCHCWCFVTSSLPFSLTDASLEREPNFISPVLYVILLHSCCCTCQSHWVLNRWATNSHSPHLLCQLLCPFLLTARFISVKGKVVYCRMQRVQRGNSCACRSPTFMALFYRSFWVFKLIDGEFPEPCHIVHHAFLNPNIHSSSRLGQGCWRQAVKDGARPLLSTSFQPCLV